MHVHHLFRQSFYWFILGSIALEIVWYLLIQKRSYPWREMASSVGVYALRIPTRLLRPLIVGPLAFFLWSHRLTTIPLNTAWGLVLLFLGVEFTYYCMHRASHEVRWLWASHLVHHTPKLIHLASAFRLGGTELLSGTWVSPAAVSARAQPTGGQRHVVYQPLLSILAAHRFGRSARAAGVGIQHPPRIIGCEQASYWDAGRPRNILIS
jgi:sterol desaturase/sphingolipid hydroxylase (fatty acid hydroxylase superfamily)